MMTVVKLEKLEKLSTKSFWTFKKALFILKIYINVKDFYNYLFNSFHFEVNTKILFRLTRDWNNIFISPLK